MQRGVEVGWSASASGRPRGARCIHIRFPKGTREPCDLGCFQCGCQTLLRSFLFVGLQIPSGRLHHNSLAFVRIVMQELHVQFGTVQRGLDGQRKLYGRIW